jgi:uncharacterized protein (DUF2236 family)
MEQAMAEFVPGPDSVLWRYAGDPRILVTAGSTLVLQVAHPTVGAGVREHSDYASDPWGRLLRTLDYSYLMIFGGREAAEATGRRLREMHKEIKGTMPDGRRYHALEPEAFTWVHATLIQGIVEGHRRFGRPLDDDQIESAYDEWRALGRLIGIREGDLPADWPRFLAYFDRMVDDRLEDNDVVHGVLSVLRRPAPPKLRLIERRLWRLTWLPFGRLFSLATVGLLPTVLRERCDLRWTRSQGLELRALGKAVRSATPLMRGGLGNVGPGYLRWRRDQIARGELLALTERAPVAQPG